MPSSAPPSAPPRAAATLPLQVDAHTKWGESIAVLGSWDGWEKRSPVRLDTSADLYPRWSAALALPPGTGDAVEYKYAVVRSDGTIARWEPGQGNRTATLPVAEPRPDVFGELAKSKSISRDVRRGKHAAAQPHLTLPDVDVGMLDKLERSLVAATAAERSWRQRLSFVRRLFTDAEAASAADFESSNLEHLATLSAYLTYLSSGQIVCEEDGGHHRPNHHAAEARRIDAALAALPHAPGAHAYVSYVVRRIFPHMPSYASQFTVSVPLTRIRDIAHRGDIPKDLKTEIKHTLQNKLHRCAGPEDLKTSERILARIDHGGYSQPFVDQFRIFHAELRQFFNAASLDDRLAYLRHTQETAPTARQADHLLRLKHERAPAPLQLEVLVELRASIASLPLMCPVTAGKSDELPSEHVQKTRLADIELEGYAFLLLAGVAKDAEKSFEWESALHGLVLAMRNIALSGLCSDEVNAAADELTSVRDGLQRVDKLRVKAAVERALRFAESFSEAISDVYSRRASSIGQALGVDGHAIAVFAEAEIRANVTFQASRIADKCAHVCRKELGLPPWDPLYAGAAVGRLVYVDHLADLSQEGGEGDVVAVCRDAEGDEDIPPHVCGVVLGRSLPHLSHLGVRARQAGVIFVCAEDREVFDAIWRSRKQGLVRMAVTAQRGLAALEDASMTDKDSPTFQANSDKQSDVIEMPKKVNVTFNNSVKRPLTMAEVTKETTASKSAFAGKLYAIAAESNGIFEVPDGVALPHGIFQAQRAAHASKYTALVKRYEEASKGTEADTVAEELFNFVKSNFKAEQQVCSAVQQRFSDGAVSVMVRSSANAEDLEDMSGAGLYDSIANITVSDTEGLQNAIAEVWASLWTRRAASSRAAYGVRHDDVSMAVLIQEMVTADLSFVAFSKDPVSKEDGAYIEIAVGMGETLASGSLVGSPYRFRVRNTSTQTVSYASFSDALLPNEEDSGLVPAVVNYSKQSMTIDDEFREDLVVRIADIVRILEAQFRGPQDIEGAVKVDGSSCTVFVVQARPQIL